MKYSRISFVLSMNEKFLGSFTFPFQLFHKSSSSIFKTMPTAQLVTFALTLHCAPHSFELITPSFNLFFGFIIHEITI